MCMNVFDSGKAALIPLAVEFQLRESSWIKNFWNQLGLNDNWNSRQTGRIPTPRDYFLYHSSPPERGLWISCENSTATLEFKDAYSWAYLREHSEYKFGPLDHSFSVRGELNWTDKITALLVRPHLVRWSRTRRKFGLWSVSMDGNTSLISKISRGKYSTYWAVFGRTNLAGNGVRLFV